VSLHRASFYEPLLEPPPEPPLLEDPRPPRETELLLPEMVLPDDVVTRVPSFGTVVVPPLTGWPMLPVPP
jgi:hypothetical protein